MDWLRRKRAISLMTRQSRSRGHHHPGSISHLQNTSYTTLYKQIKTITRTTKQQQQQITKPTSHKHEDILIIRTHFSTPNWTQSVGSGQVVYKLVCLQCKLPGMYTNSNKATPYCDYIYVTIYLYQQPFLPHPPPASFSSPVHP